MQNKTIVVFMFISLGFTHSKKIYGFPVETPEPYYQEYMDLWKILSCIFMIQLLRLYVNKNYLIIRFIPNYKASFIIIILFYVTYRLIMENS